MQVITINTYFKFVLLKKLLQIILELNSMNFEEGKFRVVDAAACLTFLGNVRRPGSLKIMEGFEYLSSCAPASK
jgi:hypothetical protein